MLSVFLPFFAGLGGALVGAALIVVAARLLARAMVRDVAVPVEARLDEAQERIATLTERIERVDADLQGLLEVPVATLLAFYAARRKEP